MSKRSPDFQKQEAKQSLWDQDGQHIPKRYRNKGKGRSKDKKEIRKVVQEEINRPYLEKEEEWSEEVDDALYCHFYGPCGKCKALREDT